MTNTITLPSLPEIDSDFQLGNQVLTVVSLKPNGKFITVSDYSLGYPNSTTIEQFEMEACDYSLGYPNCTKFNIEIAD
jgi:hypothetical protein